MKIRISNFYDTWFYDTWKGVTDFIDEFCKDSHLDQVELFALIWEMTGAIIYFDEGIGDLRMIMNSTYHMWDQ